jgi:hypothetical protein
MDKLLSFNFEILIHFTNSEEQGSIAFLFGGGAVQNMSCA